MNHTEALEMPLGLFSILIMFDISTLFKNQSIVNDLIH